MNNSIQYFLGNLGLEGNSAQSKMLRNIVLSDKSEKEILSEFEEFVLSQSELNPDTILIINKSIMAGYGSEYLGLGKDDYHLKTNLYKRFTEKFPDEFAFKFYYADCCLLNGQSADEIYPIIKSGMIADKANIYYPSSELFQLIHESKFSFEFDMLLLDKYYQPCEKEAFNEWINEFKECYKNDEEQIYLNNLKWKGNNNSG